MYHIILCKKEPLREDYWWVAFSSASRREIEKQYDKYFYEDGLGHANMRIVVEI